MSEHSLTRRLVPVERALQQLEGELVLLPVGREHAQPVERVDRQRVCLARRAEDRKRLVEQAARLARLLRVHEVGPEHRRGGSLDKARTIALFGPLWSGSGVCFGLLREPAQQAPLLVA
eukprot:scaffold9836_cov97-Isochrysis_galbana.AAC.2